jgi:DNA-cytosine methyltransferase
MRSKMNLLSVFDGMGCGMIALKELGIKVNKYYSSEIDKFANQQTKHNFPEIIQLGDITKIKAKDLEKIDLFIGGSPCQGFSFAGKQLNFDDPRSKLFFDYVRLWNEIKSINPDAKFLLENVNMKKEYLRVISEHLGVFPVRINSNLVSAQNRDRWYWTNIKTKHVGLFTETWTDIPHPKDRGILLKDILQDESEVDEKYYLSDKIIKGFNKKKNRDLDKGNGFGMQTPNLNGKSNTLVARYYKDGKENIIKLDKQGNKKPGQNKAGCLTGGGHSGGNHSDMDIICVSMVGRKLDENGVRKDNSNIKAVQRLEPKTDGKTNFLTSVHKDNLLTDGYKLRRLTPVECSRLQTIPEWYKWIVSDTQIYKMLGNGWTVEVIKHIFKYF